MAAKLNHISVSDERLYQLMQGGSDKAYYELFEKYWEPLYSIAVKLTTNRELAKDVVQDVFLAFWKNRKSKDIENVAAYLHRAAKFGSLNLIRDEKSQLHQEVEEIHGFEVETDQHLDAEELQKQIDAVVQSLPTKCRQVFELSRYEHLTNAEIAEQLDLSKRTVETHISNALKQLRNQLPQHFGTIGLLTYFLN
ncbi:MAG: RNA polymerase sigma-70 factor [Bacteroidetes bacterium]|nr:RNA polymerase sigma-70 factor [Bacteroidota bacterium]